MDKLKTGELIREARKGKKYTQSELGDLIGVTNKAVSRWENGESFPDIGVLENLAQVLDLKVQDIVTGEVNPNIYSVDSRITALDIRDTESLDDQDRVSEKLASATTKNQNAEG